MAFKIVFLAAFIAAATASTSYSSPLVHSYGAPVAYAAPAYAAAPTYAYSAPIAKAVIAEPSAPAHYDYGYSVSDPHTGDNKAQYESRRGDVVKGSYSLIDSDGTKRIVDYSADPHNGFNAVVHKEAAVAHAYAAPVATAAYAAPVAHAAYAAPVATAYAAPVAHAAYAAPLAHAAYAAPVAHSYSGSYAAPGLSYAAHHASPYYYH